MAQNAELIDLFALFIKTELRAAKVANKGNLVEDIDDFLYQAKLKYDPNPVFQDARQRQKDYLGLEAMHIPTAKGSSE